MTRRALAKLLGDVRLAYVDGLLEDLAAAYEDKARGIQVHVEDGRALLRVKNEYVNRVAHIAPQQDVPRPVLRTLAVIAYNHPMTQADLVRVRGNKAYAHVQELIERELIRPEPEGRTLLLKITPEFLRHFGLKTIEEFRLQAGSPELEIPPEAAETEAAPDPGADTEIDTETEAEPEANETAEAEDLSEIEVEASRFGPAVGPNQPIGDDSVDDAESRETETRDPTEDEAGEQEEEPTDPNPELPSDAPDDETEDTEPDAESDDEVEDEPEVEGGQ